MRIFLLTCGLCLFLSPVFAFGPADALLYQAPELRPAGAMLSAAEAQLRAARLGASGTYSTSYSDSTFNHSLSLSYREDQVNLLSAHKSNEDAQRQLISLQRDGIKQALLAHASLWDAQAKGRAAKLHAQIAGQNAVEAERKRKIGEAAEYDVELARVDAEDAALAERTAAEAEISAKAEAARLGLTGAADPVVLTFMLSPAKVDDADAIYNSNWDFRLADASAAQARRDNRIYFGADASYTGKYQLSAGVSTKGPSVTASTGYPSLYDPTLLFFGSGWRFTLSATVPLDPGATAAARVKSADAEVARVKLEQQRSQQAIKLPDALKAAQDAARSMDLARQRLALAERKLKAVQARAKSGTVSPQAELEAAEALATAEATLAQRWQTYITDSATYLESINAPWEVTR
ncbi:MAG: TolC family protein [bacterium]